MSKRGKRKRSNFTLHDFFSSSLTFHDWIIIRLTPSQSPVGFICLFNYCLLISTEVTIIVHGFALSLLKPAFYSPACWQAETFLTAPDTCERGGLTEFKDSHAGIIKNLFLLLERAGLMGPIKFESLYAFGSHVPGSFRTCPAGNTEDHLGES